MINDPHWISHDAFFFDSLSLGLKRSTRTGKLGMARRAAFASIMLGIFCIGPRHLGYTQTSKYKFRFTVKLKFWWLMLLLDSASRDIDIGVMPRPTLWCHQLPDMESSLYCSYGVRVIEKTQEYLADRDLYPFISSCLFAYTQI